MGISGHAWTILPHLWHRVLPAAAPEAQDWSTELHDQTAGPVTLSGRLRAPEGSRDCLVVVHGLGSTTDAHYAVAVARAAERAGLACLRICLRGADRQGHDFYHGGLTDDLSAALRSPALARFERIWVIGFSLGGHMTLRYALSPCDPRVRAVAAVCPPLDLDRSATAIDRRRSRVYLQHLLDGLNEIYAAVAARGPVPTPLEEVLRARRIRTWDGLTVAPRFGFDSAEDYYARMSVGPRLSDLQVPALILQSESDPMVPPWTYAHVLSDGLPGITLRRVREGGHVAFPRDLDLDLGAPGSAPMLDQIVTWLQRHD